MPRVQLGPITVGAFYSRFSGPYAYGYPYAFGCGTLLWDPYCGPYLPYYSPWYFTGFARGGDKGQVMLAVEPREAQVFLDGGLAGTANHLKNIWLDPGAYDLMVTADHRTAFRQRIYILSGKTLKITAELAPEKVEVKP